MQLTQNIASYEVLPKALHAQVEHHPRSIYRLIDRRIIVANQRLIERHGTMNYNTWYWGGKHEYRGFRPFDSTEGAPLSQHKFGRALDGVPKHLRIPELHADILAHPRLYLSAGFTTFEVAWDAPTWLHGDCRWHDRPGQLLFVAWDGSTYTLDTYKEELQNRKIV